MANKKQTKRQKDIKSKLMAAICMLLVSSIMMVSSTYAWFTLSTAPEVSGITTQVGANGNLEMALSPLDGNIADIRSSATDGAAAINLKNTTWGNLVDLSENTFYGLNQIVLYPAALNETDGVLGSSFLLNPLYGADGRVSNLAANSVTSTFEEGEFPQNENFGVRAVGTASGMTTRQLTYRNYLSTANTAKEAAKTLASNSLKVNGQSLANIAVAHGADADATFDKDDVDSLKAIVDDLLGTNEKTGVLESIENSYRAYIIAYIASSANDATDEVVNGVLSILEATEDLDDLRTTLADEGIALPAGASDMLDALDDTKAEVESAQDDLNDITATDGIAWSALSVPLNKLADIDSMSINGIPVSEAKDRAAELIASISNLKLTIESGGGVYADVADHCGNYGANVSLQINYQGADIGLDARMETATALPVVYLEGLKTAVSGKSPSSAGGERMPISDMYGYIIDLAFRTNAAESNLLLATLPEGRIYSENGSEETMGHGSTMTFTTSDTSFSTTQMAGLMEAIRLVFFDPKDNNTVLAYAKLDMTAGNYTVDEANKEITAKVYLYEKVDAATTTEYVQATFVEDDTAEGGFRQVDDGTGTHALVNGEYVPATHVYNEETEEYEAVDTGATHAAKEVQTAAGERMITEKTDAVITALTQNTAQAVSVLVYLDGNYVENGDVSTTAMSLTGSLNLQFASSATLTPMDYTPLQSQGTATPPANPETPDEGNEG